jgi:hypothetical protein
MERGLIIPDRLPADKSPQPIELIGNEQRTMTASRAVESHQIASRSDAVPVAVWASAHAVQTLA